MCHKVSMGYRAAHEALGNFKRHLWKSRLKKMPRRAYWCDECRSWHLTSMNVTHRRMK
jgi:uncharacterized protein YlaI